MLTRSSSWTRRRFLFASTAGAAASFSLPGALARAAAPRRVSANEKLNIAAIGAGGKGAEDTDGCASENIVALCDVDSKRLAERAAKYPKAKLYRDYRKMLEEMKEIDAVLVSTPDHHHAFAAVMAMKLGKHVYCQKPLTHSIWEARLMRTVASRAKVATQMGNQGHSYDSTRRIVELVRAGVLGEVREVHVWTDRPIWPQGINRPKDTPPVPDHIDWDLWLGPAPPRPYHPDYVPFKWRGWWDFGTGALGDMACHNADAAFWALDLDAPISVQAESSPVNNETCPKWSVIRYEFPARGTMPPVTLTWYDGGKMPSRDLVDGSELPKNGTILIGSKARIAFRDWHPNEFRLLPQEQFKDFKGPAQTIPRAPDGPYQEWIAACKGGPPCLSNFDYAGRLTETVLLGNVAVRVGRKIEWDAKKLAAKGCPDADQYIRREYRKGWTLKA
ncbi:MAG TPA: Gfo/Idh/MocA family oxidoreductase [Verrucomicrobiae bacterium]|nr:Gfo/Idh/MocA family oxidoreductase [Verrucomicrobiae bacterium]